MVNRERRLPRKFTQLGQGIETTAYRHGRGDKDSVGVLKGFDQTAGPGFAKAGFDRVIRDRLAANHAALQHTYGDIILNQRFLQRRGLKTERFKLVQEFVDKAKPASVLDYQTEELPAEALSQLKRITPIFARELAKALAGEEAVILDSRNRNNLVVGKDGKLHCLDTGLMNVIQPGTEEYFVWKHRLAPLALMELVAGDMPDKVLTEPLLQPLIQYLQDNAGLDLAQAQVDAVYLRGELEKFYKNGKVDA